MKIKNKSATAISLLIIAAPAFSEVTWSEINTASFIQGCISGVVDPARRDYFARAKQVGNPYPKPFPEEELRKSVEPMCSCVTEKLIVNGVPSDAAINQSPEAKSITERAISSGECKLGGALGAVLSKQIRQSDQR
ncbi:MAG: hypothetical protein KBT63_00230 [Porticoccaceae bacterium]|nr:hypothetical protein [Porticoccaceae bacterium]